MKQILHIFRKDVRRLWMEILVSIVAVALFAWAIPKTWISVYVAAGSKPSREIGHLLYIIVPLSWGLLIARLIHGEPLVGDRQFWITRPYEWPKLLAAKVLFVLLLIYIPFLLMQAAILFQVGFNPLSHLPGLLYELLLISLVFFPLLGLAAVTSNLVRMLLTILGVLVVLGLVSSIVFSTVGTNGNNSNAGFWPIPWGGLASILVVLLVCGAVIVLQYARRRALVARLLLGSAPFLVLLVSFLANSSAIIRRAYPLVADADPFALRMISDEQDDARRAGVDRWSSNSGSTNYFNIDRKKWAEIKVELRASGVAAGDRWQLDAFRPTLTPANGAPVKLDWLESQEVFDTPDTANYLSYHTISFLVRRSDYERLKSSVVSLHLDFALTEATPARSWHFSLPKGDFRIPDLASCSAIDNREMQVMNIFAIFCRFPLKTPALFTVTALQTRGPCELAPAQPGDPSLPISRWFGNFDAAPASFGISPMEESAILSGSGYNPDPKIVPTRLCPGAPVVVTQYRKVRSLQTGIKVENFNLAGEPVLVPWRVCQGKTKP